MWIIFIFLGLSLRLFNLSSWFYFTHDEETIVWRTMPWLRDSNPFLLGGVTPFHIHLGPWFYYLSALILKLSNLDPLGWGIAASLVSLFTMGLIFYTGKLLFNRRVGLFALALYATSFLMIAFDRHWWPLYFSPLISLLVVLSLYQLIHGKSAYIILLALTLAFGFHTDPSNWGLLLLALITWIKFKPKIGKNYFRSAIFILFISFIPLILFDVLHTGTNLKGVSQYFTETKPHQGWSFDRFLWVLLYVPRSLSRLLYAGSSDLTSSYAYCREFAHGRLHQVSLGLLILTIAVIAIFFAFAWKNRRQPAYWLISSYFLLLLIGLNIYGNFFSSDLFDHYLTTLFPLFFLIIAWFLDRLWSRAKPIVILSLITFLFINLLSYFRATTQDDYLLKRQAVDWAIKEVGSQSFAIDSLSSCFRYNGTRYLFTLAGKEPVQSFVDENFFWLYRQPPSTSHPELLVAFVHQDVHGDPHLKQQYLDYLSRLKARRSFGPWEVLIVDNTIN